MIIYILMVSISIFFAFLSQNVKTSLLKKLYFIFSFLPFFIVSAFRYNVGTDYLYRYVPIFNIILRGGKVQNLEYGYELLNKIAITFSKEYTIIFILTSMIILFLIFYTINKKSQIKWLSIYILFFGSFYFQSLNIVRQYISIAIILCSSYFIFNKKYIKYYLSVFMAMSFHTSSFCAIVLPFFQKKVLLNIKKVLFFTFIVIFFRDNILDVVEYLFKYIKYGDYFNTTFNRSDLRIYPLIFNLLVYLIIYYIYGKKRSNNEITNIDNFYINAQGMAIISLLLGNVTYLSFRFTYYFSIFQIISIPHFISYFYKKREYVFLKLIIVILFACNIFYTNVLHNEEEVLPYYTIWNRG